jgi:DeoR family glycerol-3-phosphate regulon repressor
MSLSSRQKDILGYLEQHPGVLSSTLLSEQFDVSVQTIRKDMNELSDRGLVKRVHGGVCVPGANDNLSFSNREVINLLAKQTIAQRVANSLEQGTSIFLGIGTTPKQVAHALLDHPGLTVVTNNINAALVLSRNPQIRIFLAGGLVRSSDEDTVGENTTDFYRRFNIKIGIFGVGGLSSCGNLLDFTPEEADLNQAIIDQSHQCWLVADRSKLERYAPIVSATLGAIDKLFVDCNDPKIRELCQQFNVEYIDSEHE